VRASSIMILVMLLASALSLLQNTASANTSYITVYGELAYYQCPSTTYSNPLVGSCQNYFYLLTNGTTPGIPSNATLNFSESLVPVPAQSDVGRTIEVTGYYGQESQCPIANGCFVFFVQVWELYSRPSSMPTSTGCFTSSNPPTTWYSVQCVTAPTIPLAVSSQSLTNPVPFNLGTFLSNPSNLIIIPVTIGAVYLFLRARKK